MVRPTTNTVPNFKCPLGFWGLAHIMAGTIVLSAYTHTGFSAIADAVYAGDLTANYHPAEGLF